MILSDYLMAPMDGFEFKRKVDEQAADDSGVFIMVTAYDTPDVIERAAKEGVELLFKPFRVSALVDAMTRIMGQEDVNRLLNRTSPR